MSPPGKNGNYEVHCSAAIAKVLRKIQRRATRLGMGKRVLKAFKQVIRQLHLDPFHSGEILYRLPALKLKVGIVVARPLVVHFAVSEDRPIVYIKFAELLGKEDGK